MSPKELLDKLGISYVERTSRLMMSCVFHHDTNPSSGFYTDTEKFFCFSCAISLDVPGFYAKYKEMPRAQALKDLGYSHEPPAKYDKRKLNIVQLRAEGALSKKKELGRVEHAKLGERLDKITWAYEHNLLDEGKFDQAVHLWYVRLDGIQESITDGTAGNSLHGGLKASPRPVSRPVSKGHRQGVEREIVDESDGLCILNDEGSDLESVGFSQDDEKDI